MDAWRDAVRRGLALLALLRGSLPSFDTLDVGGGFPVAPIGTPSPAPERFARGVPALLAAIPADRRPDRLAVEPGRFLVARAGWLVASVLHVRERGGRHTSETMSRGDRDSGDVSQLNPPGVLCAMYEEYMRKVIEVARRNPNAPFGALLDDAANWKDRGGRRESLAGEPDVARGD